MRLRFLCLLPLAVACALAPTGASAQSGAPLTGGLAQPESESSQLFVRTILIRPKASETKLSSRFFPSRDELKQGSAAPIILRMNWEASQRIKILRDLYTNERLEVPLEEWNTEAIDKSFPINLNEMTRAVFRERAGWEYPLDEEPQLKILLPDVQESRRYVHAMLLKARAAVKHGKVEEAERMLCLAIGMARHIGETPFAVSRLVQYVLTGEAFGVVEELAQHPQAPNYYWDFASLPRPFIDVRSALQFESEIFAHSVAELNNLENLKTEEQWNELAAKVWSLLHESASGGDDSIPKPGSLEATQAIEDWVALSRERLPKMAPEFAPRLSRMSDAEVGVRYWWLRVQTRTKAQYAVGLLEPQFALPRLMADVARFEKDAEDELPVQVASVTIASFIAVAPLLDQKIVMLRAVESIRDYAASHDGKLPGSLAELELPVPADPISGAVLEYQAADDRLTASLSGGTLEMPYSPRAAGDSQKKNVRGMRYKLKIAER